MGDLLTEVGYYIITGIGFVLLFLISKFALGFLIVRFLIKLSVLTSVIYFGAEFTNFLQDMLSQYLPSSIPIMALACQMGFFDGINLFFKIVFSAYSYRLIIRTIITS